MGDRLGEHLVKAGKITEAQLASVLERQVTMGGRLGTNLVELGYLTEQELTDFLSKKLNIPSTTATDFKNIDPEVVKLVPAKVAQKYSVMPLRKERNTLIVAMVSPTDFEAANELAFITSCTIRPCVATEARIQYAHENYYGISRQLRYISILDEERKQREIKAAAETEGMQKPSSREELEVALKVATAGLAQATSLEEVIESLLRQFSIFFDRAVFFVLKKETVTGFRTHSPQLDQDAIKSLEIPLAEASIFKEAVERRDLCLGVLDSSPGNQRLLKALGGPAPKEALVAPVMMKEQIVALFYGDNSTSSCGPLGLEFIRKVVYKASLALEILILRKKLLEM